MEFNPSKCQLLQITSSSSKKPIPTSYSLHGQTLETADHAKYLGVVIGSTLKWIFHISRITCNANRSLGFVRRNIKCKNPKIREAAYKSLVRPQLEFASSAWDPHCQGHIKQIEQVQRRAARWTLNDYRPQASVSTMLSTLGWRPLQQRWALTRMTLFYKIVNGFVIIPLSSNIVRPMRQSSRGHPLRYMQVQATRDSYKYSFFPSQSYSGMRYHHALYSHRLLMPLGDRSRSGHI